MLKDTKVSLKEFQEKDYCFELTDDLLSHDIDEYLDQVNDILAENISDLEKRNILEASKRIKVYNKEYIKLPIGFIQEHIRDYFEDNYGCEFYDFDVLEYVNVEKECKQITDKINNSKHWYTLGSLAGYMDLSEQVEEVIRS